MSILRLGSTGLIMMPLNAVISQLTLCVNEKNLLCTTSNLAHKCWKQMGQKLTLCIGQVKMTKHFVRSRYLKLSRKKKFNFIQFILLHTRIVVARIMMISAQIYIWLKCVFRRADCSKVLVPKKKKTTKSVLNTPTPFTIAVHRIHFLPMERSAYVCVKEPAHYGGFLRKGTFSMARWFVVFPSSLIRTLAATS